MYDLNFLFAMFLQIFSQQAPMALLWGVFAAEETGSVERLGAIFLYNLPVIQYLGVNFLIFWPGHFLLMPLVKKLFGGSEVNNVLIGDMADFVGEKLQILTFCKPRQLATIADAHIDELFGTYTAEDQLNDAYRLKNKEIGYKPSLQLEEVY